MRSPDPKRVASMYQARQLLAEAHTLLQGMEKVSSRVKTAGEVVFRKDLSGDANQWAYAIPGPSERFLGEFKFAPKNAKPLAKSLRSSLAALGHVLSAYNTFAKIKSARVSPDGSLGGKGYIMKISDMRRQFMNVVEALSALSDTLYDEVNAPHWSFLSRLGDDPEAKQELAELIQDAEEIRENPEGWAEDQLEEEFEDESSATAKSTVKTASKVASRWFEENSEGWGFGAPEAQELDTAGELAKRWLEETR